MDPLRIAFDTKQARSTEEVALRNAVGPWLIQEDRYSRLEEMRKSRSYLSQPSYKEGYSTFPKSSYCRRCQRPFWTASELEEHERSTRPKQRSDGVWICRTIAQPIEEQKDQDDLTEVKISGSSSLSETRKSLTCPYNDCSKAYADRILLDYHLRIQHGEQTKEVMAKSDHIGIPGPRSWIAFDKIYDESGRGDIANEERHDYNSDEEDDELGELLEIVSPSSINRGHGINLRQKTSHHSLVASVDSHQSLSQSRNWYHSLASPGSFQTAHSSLASYATATSGSSLEWQSDFARASGHLAQTSGFPSPEQMFAISTESSDAFERFVEVVTTHAISHVASSAGIMCLSKDESERLKGLLVACLRPVRQINKYANGQVKHGSKHSVQTDLLSHKIIEQLVGYKISDDTRFDLNKALNRFTFESSLKSCIRQFIAASKSSANMVTHKKIFTSEWLAHLQDRGILLDPSQELDWSGKGQHMEYTDAEANEIPLRSENILGHSQTAVIDSVRCRRIRLARKSITCNRRLKREDVVAEVEHLLKLQHSHVVRIVGTYTMKKNLAILLYPAAEWNLDAFMDEALEHATSPSETGCLLEAISEALKCFFGCLSIAIAFIHGRNIKHMDIKPKNILVKRKGATFYKAYIADFGIARSYKSAADSETDSPVSFTRIYAAPEVVLQDTRGFSADIFSLGAVFMEMVATLCSLLPRALDERQMLLDLRKRTSGNPAFYANIDVILTWYDVTIRERFCTWEHDEGEVFGLGIEVMNIIPLMISEVPYSRPTASALVEHMSNMSCMACDDGPEPFEAAD